MGLTLYPKDIVIEESAKDTNVVAEALEVSLDRENAPKDAELAPLDEEDKHLQEENA